MEPSYIRTYESGILKERGETLHQALHDCTLCPRQCHADRLSGDTGDCKTAEFAVVSSCMSHHGEESPISGIRGSGTIFFTHCNLGCNFCQNFDISNEGRGRAVSSAELADRMLQLQKIGCHNINLVTPSHVVPQILQALLIAIPEGLRRPLVFNSGGYDLVSTMRSLDGIIDIYMPDFKFWDPGVADTTCQAPDYPEIAKSAVREMHRQVGDFQTDGSGLAVRGLLVRHLVMPDGMAGTKEVMEYISREISPDTYVNIMPQYRPCGNAMESPNLNRPITMKEFHEAVQIAIDAGLKRLDN